MPLRGAKNRRALLVDAFLLPPCVIQPLSLQDPRPDGRQVSIFERDNPGPPMITTDLEKGLIRLETIRYNTDIESGVPLFKRLGQSSKGLEFTILFVILCRIFDPLCRQ